MTILIFSFFIFGLAFLGMAISVTLGSRKRCLKGSCSSLDQPNKDANCCNNW